MQLIEIRRQANILIDSLSGGGTIAQPVLERFINRGYRLLNNIALFNLTALSLSTTNGTRTVALPADFLALRDVYYSNKRVTYVPYDMLNLENTTAGTPKRYSIRGSTLYFDPIPDTTGSTITGWYYATVTDLSGPTDEPTTFPSQYHDYLIDYAVYEGLLLLNKPEAAGVYKKRFDEGAEMLAAYFDRDRSREHIKTIRASLRTWGKSEE